MNRKLIFEAPGVPGGLVFVLVADPTYNEHKLIADAEATGVYRFKGSEPTLEPAHPLRFAPERFDLGWLVEEVVSRRPISEHELERVRSALTADRVPREVEVLGHAGSRTVHIPSRNPDVNRQPLPPSARRTVLRGDLRPSDVGRSVILRNNGRTLDGVLKFGKVMPLDAEEQFYVLGQFAVAGIAPSATIEFVA